MLPFFYIPSYISAVLRGEQPRSLHADDGGDCRYAPDASRGAPATPLKEHTQA